MSPWYMFLYFDSYVQCLPSAVNLKVEREKLYDNRNTSSVRLKMAREKTHIRRYHSRWILSLCVEINSLSVEWKVNQCKYIH